MRLLPATRERDWIETTSGRFGSRCLPLLMANQAGWFVLNSAPLLVTWDGGEGTKALRLVRQGEPPYPAVSHFRHGISPLKALVGADWTVAIFVMNWKLTAIETPVRFEAGESICMLVPQRRGELERFLPEIRDAAMLPGSTSATERQAGLTLRPFVESAGSRPPPGAPDRRTAASASPRVRRGGVGHAGDHAVDGCVRATGPVGVRAVARMVRRRGQGRAEAFRLAM